MVRFVALMDEYGNELSYPNYHRAPMPPLDGDEDWVLVAFNRYTGREVILVLGAWICDSETSRMRDGEWVPFVQMLKPEEHFHLHLRTERGMDAAQQLI